MSKNINVRNKTGNICLQYEKNTIIVLAVLSILSMAIFITGLSVGSTMLHPMHVVKYLLGIENSNHEFIINTLRLPRMLLSLLVGAALGVSGLILQGVLRNPLGSPDIIGITGGASFAAVLFITYFSKTLSIGWLPIAAILGSGIISLIVYLLAWKNGVYPLRLVLVGIGMATAMSAMTTMLIVLGNNYTTAQAYLWLTGSVYGANWGDVHSMLPWVLIFIPLAMFFSKTSNAFELGDSVAHSLGVKIQLHRFTLLLISVALAGSAVAFAGGIGFIGLIAPHISRKLVARTYGSLIPVSAIIGALIVLLSDIIARTAFLPLDLPAGIFVSGIGAPFFIYLLFKNRHL